MCLRDTPTVLSCLRDLPTILSSLLIVFYYLHIETEACVPLFKYTTVRDGKCVLFAWMDCSQELLTQGKTMLNIWNT